mgnify:CR=1 FL=1
MIKLNQFNQEVKVSMMNNKVKNSNLDHKEIKLKNSLLIIDEIQNMVSEEGTYYTELYKLITNAPEDEKIPRRHI